MKNLPIVLFVLLLFGGCIKSKSILSKDCFSCSYTTEDTKVTKEICEDEVSDLTKEELKTQMQIKADSLQVVLTCSTN